MSVLVRHKFRSMGIPSRDPSKIGPTHWNEDHDIIVDEPGVIGSLDGKTTSVIPFDRLAAASRHIADIARAVFAELHGDVDNKTVPLYAFKIAMVEAGEGLFERASAQVDAHPDMHIRWGGQTFVVPDGVLYKWLEEVVGNKLTMLQLMQRAKEIATRG